MYIFAVAMKRLLLSILAVVYLVTASGMSFHLHYCMDKLASLSWNAKSSKCPACGKQKNHSTKIACKGCCKDEYKHIKLDNSHKAEQTISPKFFTEKAVSSYCTIESVDIASPNEVAWTNIHAPPQKYKVSSFVFNCVFRI